MPHSVASDDGAATLSGMDISWLGDRPDVVVIEGPDAATYLQSQASQDLRGMVVGDARWTFLLQPTGKVDVLARVTMTGDERFELDTDAGFGPELEARLNRFKIRVKATVEPAESAAESAVGSAVGSVVGSTRSTRTRGSPRHGRRWAPRSCRARRSLPRPA